MPREAYASLRLPPDLKAEVQEIATAQQRSLSNAIELLLRLGVRRYRQTGLLIEGRRRPSDPTEVAVLSLLDEMPRERQEEVLRIVRVLHEECAAPETASVD